MKNLDSNLESSCIFEMIPNHDKSHDAYLSVFRNDDSTYAIAIDNNSGLVIFSKTTLHTDTVCRS